MGAKKKKDWMATEAELAKLSEQLGGDSGTPSDGGGDSVDPAPSESAVPFGRDDIEWVYLNLGAKKVNLSTAPNAGAIAWLNALEASPAAKEGFYRNIMPKLLPKEVRTSEAQREFVGAKQIENCEDLLLKLKKEAEDASD